jgi:hypothetical protein
MGVGGQFLSRRGYELNTSVASRLPTRNPSLAVPTGAERVSAGTSCPQASGAQWLALVVPLRGGLLP